jgi:hypothetical protein
MSTKVKSSLIFLLLLAVVLGATLYWRIHDAPRRESLASLTRLDTALHSGSRTELLDLLVIPAVVRNRTAPEQSEFLAKALNDEISPEGLAVLKQHGAFGPLKKLFPAEAETWAAQAGVSSDECVAFKLDRNGLRAEVVLVKPSTLNPQPSTGEAPYRIVRVNNVKQLATPAPLSTTENKP